jgi:hypothetical protein
MKTCIYLQNENHFDVPSLPEQLSTRQKNVDGYNTTRYKRYVWWEVKLMRNGLEKVKINDRQVHHRLQR